MPEAANQRNLSVRGLGKPETRPGRWSSGVIRELPKVSGSKGRIEGEIVVVHGTEADISKDLIE